jgi:carboxyl-terminal processing protease
VKKIREVVDAKRKVNSEKQPLSKSGKILLGGLGALIIFGFGVSVGTGNISLGIHGNAANGNLPANLDYSSVNEVYQDLRAKYDGKLTTQMVLNGLKSGLADATGDPYTDYFTPKEAKKFNNELNNSFTGIGAELSKDSKGRLEIIAPIKHFPAAKAGLKAQDRIMSINGKSTNGIDLNSAVQKIRGKAGTKVKLGILRNGKQLNFTITRAHITVPSVMSKILPGNIGYMSIITFGDDTSELSAKAAQKFKNHHVKGVILDLRNNPGGEVNAAVNVSSLWLKQDALIMQEKRGGNVIDSYYATGTNPLENVPTVVLINGGSASAAEITAGALHDHHAAYLIGTKSFGKGIVQQLIGLEHGGKLKVTVASWYRPNGKNIEHKGITPDKTVKLTKQNTKTGTGPQLQAAKDYLASHD